MIRCEYTAADVKNFKDKEALYHFIMYIRCAMDENKRSGADNEYRKFHRIMGIAIDRLHELEKEQGEKEHERKF